MEGKEGTKIPAHGEQKSKDTNKFDGSTLIQFTRESIEAGFTFNKDEGRFTLSEWDKIDRFALETLSTWEHSFKIFYHGEASLSKEEARNKLGNRSPQPRLRRNASWTDSPRKQQIG